MLCTLYNISFFVRGAIELRPSCCCYVQHIHRPRRRCHRRRWRQS